MGIDWVTFVAQIVNLFVLIWLLKRFLYRPILNTIDKRQAEINAQIQSAQEAKERADKEKAEWEKEKSRFDDMRQKRLNDLAQEEQTLRQQSVQSIKQSDHEKRMQLQQSLNAEVDTIQDEIRSVVAHQFVTLSKKVLTELADCTPMDNVIKTIQNKMTSLPAKQRKEIEKNITKQNVISVSSSVELNKKQQQELLKSLKDLCPISPKTKLSWDVVPELILGIEIHIGNNLLEWNLKNYLDELEHNIRDATTTLILSEKDD